MSGEQSRAATKAEDPAVPDGVEMRDLALHQDERGSLTEIFRQSWTASLAPVQWNASLSQARVLRGVHVHRVHTDYLVVIMGRMLLGLHDIRPASPTHRRSSLMTLDAMSPRAVVIPPGVAHGFYFLERSLHIYAVDAYWNGADELGCRFDSPELDLGWPDRAPDLSERDAGAGDYGEMVRQFFDRSETGVLTP